MNGNQRIIAEHLAQSRTPEDDARRMQAAQHASAAAGKRRIWIAIGLLLGVGVAWQVLGGIAWIALHAFSAATHAMGVTVVVFYWIATLGLAWWSGGLVTAARAIKHTITRVTGGGQSGLTHLPRAKAIASVVSMAMWYFAFSHVNARDLPALFGAMSLSVGIILGAIFALKQYYHERKVVAAGYNSETEMYADQMRRDEERDFEREVNAHLANMGPGVAPETIVAPESTSTLPHVNWGDDDSPLRPM